MQALHLAALAAEFEKRKIVRVLRTNPDWSLRTLLQFLHDKGPEVGALGDLTIGDLITDPAAARLRVCTDGAGSIIDLDRRERAERVYGEVFDDLLLEVLREVRPRAVAASYLTVRLGGPRWKLQASARRLVEAGSATKTGVTSGTRYAAAANDDDTSGGESS